MTTQQEENYEKIEHIFPTFNEMVELPLHFPIEENDSETDLNNLCMRFFNKKFLNIVEYNAGEMQGHESLENNKTLYQDKNAASHQNVSQNDIAVAGPSGSPESSLLTDLRVQQFENISDTSECRYSEIDLKTEALVRPSCLQKNIRQSIANVREFENNSDSSRGNYSEIDFNRDPVAGPSGWHETTPAPDLRVQQFEYNLNASSYSEMYLNGVWTCNLCKTYFKSQVEFEWHYIIHEGYHKIFCRICGESLKKHNRKTVEKKSTYQCCHLDCKFKTERKSNLREHLYTHSGLKLFRCDICGQCFRLMDSKRKHLKKHNM